MKKKAMNSTVMYGILSLVVLLVLFMIFPRILHSMPGIAEQSKCESYVKYASVSKNPITKEARVDLNRACPTKDVKIEARGKADEDIKNNALDDILTEMYLCGKRWGFWYGEVRRNPFSQWKVDNVCVVCVDLSFDDKLKAMQELNGLGMRSTKAEVPDGSGKMFYEFLTGNVLSDNVRKSASEGERDIIYTDEEGYIIYSVNMLTTQEDFWKKLGFGAALGGTGGVATALVLSPLLFITGGGGAIVAAGVATGALVGGFIGANVKEEESATLLVVSGDSESMSEDILKNCKTLGRDPFDDPWGDEE